MAAIPSRTMISLRRLLAVFACPYPLAFLGLSWIEHGWWLSLPLLAFGSIGYGSRAFRIEKFHWWKSWLKGAIGVCLFLAFYWLRSGALTSAWMTFVFALVLFLEGIRDVNYAFLRGRFDA